VLFRSHEGGGLQAEGAGRREGEAQSEAAVGEAQVLKLENKGRQNRRISIALAP
jgi:hypothetical protein